MMDARVEIRGVAEAVAALAQLEDGARRAGRARVFVGTNEPYAWGIAFGRDRSGRLRRRAGGTLALPNALAAVEPHIRPRLVAALARGADPTTELLALAQDVLRGVKEHEAVRSGNLRRSYHTLVEGR